MGATQHEIDIAMRFLDFEFPGRVEKVTEEESRHLKRLHLMRTYGNAEYVAEINARMAEYGDAFRAEVMTQKQIDAEVERDWQFFRDCMESMPRFAELARGMESA